MTPDPRMMRAIFALGALSGAAMAAAILIRTLLPH